jgi:Flp pilus assembly protein TadD, contains TPR repeats
MEDFIFYMNRGALFFNEGYFEEAISEYNEAIKLESNNPEAYCNRGLMYYNLGKYEQAINDFDSSIRLEKENPLSYYNRGLCYRELKKYNLALEDLFISKQQDPSFTETDRIIENLKELLKKPFSEITIKSDFYNQAIVAYKNGNYQLAEELYTKSIDENVDIVFLLAYKGRANARRLIGKFLEAIEDYDKVLEIENNDSTLYSNLGLVQVQMGDYEEAMSNFIKAKQISPEDPAALLGLGNLMMKLGGYKDALNNYNNLIELTSNEDLNHAMYFYNRGQANYALGKINEAIVDWKYSASQNNTKAIEVLKKMDLDNDLGKVIVKGIFDPKKENNQNYKLMKVQQETLRYGWKSNSSKGKFIEKRIALQNIRKDILEEHGIRIGTDLSEAFSVPLKIRIVEMVESEYQTLSETEKLSFHIKKNPKFNIELRTCDGERIYRKAEVRPDVEGEEDVRVVHIKTSSISKLKDNNEAYSYNSNSSWEDPTSSKYYNSALDMDQQSQDFWEDI